MIAWSAEKMFWLDGRSMLKLEQTFLTLNQRLDADRGTSLIDYRQHPDCPVEIIIGKGGLLVDGDFHSLPQKGSLKASPPQWD